MTAESGEILQQKNPTKVSLFEITIQSTREKQKSVFFHFHLAKSVKFAIPSPPHVYTHFGFPHEPKLEYVRAATALYVLVAGVVGGVVEFVFLEQVLSARGVAFGEHAFVSGQKRRTLLRRGEHFVRIPRDRVGSVSA